MFARAAERLRRAPAGGLERAVEALASGDPARIRDAHHNDLAEAAMRAYPDMLRFTSLAERLLGRAPAMSGLGLDAVRRPRPGRGRRRGRADASLARSRGGGLHGPVMRRLALAIACGLGLAGLVRATRAEPPTEAPPWQKEVAALLDGVGEIDAPGAPGSLALFHDDAVPVVVGGAEDGTRVPVVACGHLGAGRVAAFAHDGYLAASAARVAGTGRLLAQVVRHVAKKGSPVRVACVGSTLAPFLVAEGLAAEEVAGPAWSSRLGGFTVVVINRSDLAPADVAALTALVEGGVGLVAGHTGWGWLQVTRSDSILSSPLNALLRPSGICFTDGFAARTSPRGFAAAAVPGPLTHGLLAIERLVEAAARPAGISDADLRQAGTTAAETARLLPVDDRVLRPRLDALCRERAARLVPTSKKPLLARDALDRCLLVYDLEAGPGARGEKVRAHPAAADFPGAVPAAAPDVPVTLSIDLAVPRWHSTGRYAVPGRAVRARVAGAPGTPSAAGDAATGLTLRIGAHTDSLRALAAWPRVPEISRAAKLGTEATSLANPFGGLVFVDVPPGRVGRVEVTIEGAVEAPLFVLGETTPAAWRASIRRRPAPWAELGTSKVVLCVPSAEVRALDDPEALLRFWDRVLDADADLAGLPHERVAPERYVADVEISAGYMHSGYPIMTHLDAAARMVDLELLSKKGDWGLFHEMGHNHQQPDWTFEGTGEVTCNLFALYVLETVVGIPGTSGHEAFRDRETRTARYLADGAKFETWKADPFLALFSYVQLREAFGWKPFQAVFAADRTLADAERPRTEEQKRDAWMTRFSRAVGKDLGPFFTTWGIPTSAARARRPEGPAALDAAGLPAEGVRTPGRVALRDEARRRRPRVPPRAARRCRAPRGRVRRAAGARGPPSRGPPSRGPPRGASRSRPGRRPPAPRVARAPGWLARRGHRAQPGAGRRLRRASRGGRRGAPGGGPGRGRVGRRRGRRRRGGRRRRARRRRPGARLAARRRSDRPPVAGRRRVEDRPPGG